MDKSEHVRLADVARTFPGNLRHVRAQAARTAIVTAWPTWLSSEIVDAMGVRGITSPWLHQVQAAEFAHERHDCIVATGTASGKSLAYLLAGLTHLRADDRATVCYLAPTKALAQDQRRSLDDLGLPWLRASTVDGDANAEERSWARKHANWILTNPDMLHYSLLPHHERWARLFRGLRLIVLDECHAYRGLFGAHIGMVLRRLLRLAEHYDARPTVMALSATVADPGRLGELLVGRPVVPVTEDGSPRAERWIGLWQAPADSEQKSLSAQAAQLMELLVRSGDQTLTFVGSRREAEAVAANVRDHLAEDRPDLVDAVAAYRAGYLPEERRQLEDRLRSGEIQGMSTTSALELGIDISGMDAVITAGWPGTRASLWQQFGRAGRAQQPGLGVFIARDDPLDTYVVEHPEVLLDAPVETTTFDPSNPHVARGHLCCASAELPIRDEQDAQRFAPNAVALLDDLVTEGFLRRRPAGWYWTRRDRPADLVDLRGTGGAPVQIVEVDTGRLLGTVDAAAADRTVHPGAVYTHQGATFLVESLDHEQRVALVTAVEVDFTTHAQSISEVVIVEQRGSRNLGVGRLATGVVDVTNQVVGYQKRHLFTGTVLANMPLDMPERRLRTVATWWTVDLDRCIAAGIDTTALGGAAHAAEHAAIGLLPLFATCDRWDIGGLSIAQHPQTLNPTVFVYDGYPGGAGFAAHGYQVAAGWLQATRDLIAKCACRDGCPACVQSPKCGSQNQPLDKLAAVQLLRLFT
ncbi:MAG: DEAD/DEAH box helicase [Actinomycetales bacterium]